MFSANDRAAIRSELLLRASNDDRIVATAITGSRAEDREDAWSDIDLAFGVSETAELSSIFADWTAHMYRAHHAVHHVDVRAGAWIYRVFLLRNTLQVDLHSLRRPNSGRSLRPSASSPARRKNSALFPNPPRQI